MPDLFPKNESRDGIFTKQISTLMGNCLANGTCYDLAYIQKARNEANSAKSFLALI
jgi:hypothetical protein